MIGDRIDPFDPGVVRASLGRSFQTKNYQDPASKNYNCGSETIIYKWSAHRQTDHSITIKPARDLELSLCPVMSARV